MAAPTMKNRTTILLECLLVITFIVYYYSRDGHSMTDRTTETAILFFNHHVPNFSFALRCNLPGKKDAATPSSKQRCLCILLLLLSGDIEMNPGPGKASIYPCGVCEVPVTWTQAGVCCDNCGIWFHKTCEDISSRNMSLLNCSHVAWHCCRCNSINVDSFTFNSFELHTTNIFTPLYEIDVTLDSVSSCFSPLHASSPKGQTSKPIERIPSSDSTCPLMTPRNSNKENLVPQNQSNMRLLTVNCCSIRTNRAEFHTALDYIKPDLICGTESWLKGVKPGKDPTKNAIKTCEIFPPDLIVHRNDRSSGQGGGVFTAAKNSFISDAQPNLSTDCEIVWSKVKAWKSKDLYLCSFYMPHRNMNDIKNLDESIRQLTDTTREKHIIIAGDFNCPDIDWHNLSVRRGAADREIQQALIDLSIEHRLTQVHSQPTRDNNMLDLVFTNNPTIVKTSISVPRFSDHAMVVTDITIVPKVIKQKPRKIYLYTKANWDRVKEDLQCLSDKIIETSATQPDIQKLWDLFKTGIETSMNLNIPSKSSGKRKSLPWLNRGLKRMLRKKARLYKQAKKTNQWAPFKSFQKDCKKAFKKAEINYINETIQRGLEENNTKPFWSYVKSRRQDNVGVAPLKKMGRLLNDSKEKAQILVDQFKSVFTKVDGNKIQAPTVAKTSKDTITPLYITTKGVEKLLLSINTAKSKGPDMIPNLILKTCAGQLAPALATIFQLSVNSGMLPEDWRNANISPVFKKGDVHLAENYRPVSLTCVSCKLLEHIICRHILTHLEKNNILTSLNHGFRSGFSCETQLVTTVHDLLFKTDNNTQLDMAILDFSKAFDTVPHRKLLYKLEQYGITGNINKWISDFLTNRNMKVIVEGEESEAVTVESGVPQGTVLGPLLFLCHINDLPESVKSTVRLFADDCLLYRTIQSPKDHDLLQNDLHQLEVWADTWGMRFNAKKCYIMSINHRSSRFYQLDNHFLKQVPENPYLGVTLTEDLKWSSHITKITKKANSTLGFLRRNLKHCPEDCRRTAYLSLVRTTLEYSSIIWDPYYQKDIDKIERVQRQAARFITGNYTSREPGCITRMLQEQKLPPLQDRRKANRLTFFYKVVEGLVPALPCHDYLIPVCANKRKIKPKTFINFDTSNIIESQTNNNSKCYKTFQCKTISYKNSFFPKTTIEWNKLEDSVVCAPSINSFKSAVHKWD